MAPLLDTGEHLVARNQVTSPRLPQALRDLAAQFLVLDVLAAASSAQHKGNEACWERPSTIVPLYSGSCGDDAGGTSRRLNGLKGAPPASVDELGLDAAR